MADIDKLVKHLESEERYDHHIRIGNNGAIVKLINDVQTGSGRSWVNVSKDFMYDLIFDVEFSPSQEARFQTYTAEGIVKTSSVSIRSWFEKNLPKEHFKKLKEQGTIPNTWGVTAGVVSPGQKVSLNHIRQAVIKIEKSYISTSQRTS